MATTFFTDQEVEDKFLNWISRDKFDSNNHFDIDRWNAFVLVSLVRKDRLDADYIQRYLKEHHNLNTIESEKASREFMNKYCVIESFYKQLESQMKHLMEKNTALVSKNHALEQEIEVLNNDKCK